MSISKAKTLNNVSIPIQCDQKKENGLKIKMEEGEEQAQLLKVELKHQIRGCLTIALKIQAFYWMYFWYIFTTVCETIVLFGWDLLASSCNIILSLLKKSEIKRTSYFACIIIFGYWIIIQDIEILDVSVLYHFFRGQNAIKLYSIGLSLIVFQIMLTTAGKTYLGKISKVLLNSRSGPFQISLELLLGFICSIAHFFIIYIDFILFVIILNSTSNSRFLFLFSMNISKLKTSVFKKFDKKGYKKNLLFDAKDRFYKITYSIIHILTMKDRVETQLYITILTALAFTTIIDYLQNLTVLALAGELDHIKELRNKLFTQLYIKEQKLSGHENIMKCLQLNFTVIPYILFLFKFIYIIFKEIRKADLDQISTRIFLIFVIYTILSRVVFFFVRVIYRYYGRKQQKQQINI